MRKDTGDGIVLADIPGLIEGASEGVGLGHAFLRHVERCRVLLHLVDATAQDGGTPLDNYAIIRNELTYYSPSLGQRTEVIVLTKADAMEEADFNALLDAFKQATGKTVLGISAVAKQGLAPLKQQLIDLLEVIPPDITKIELVEDTKATANDDSYFSIEVVDEEEGVFAVHGGKVERWLSITDISNYQSLSRFWHVLKSMGVFNALDAHGATAGDTIVIGAEMFDYIGANASASEADFDRHREGREPLEEGQVLDFDEEDDFDPSQGQVIELNLDDWQELLTHDDSDLED
jgi:GTP-binding protein